MSNSFVHLELTTPDMAAAKDFYTKLFGWSFSGTIMADGSTYSMFKPTDGPGGGMLSMPGVPTMWLAYVGVEDIHAATEQARSLGATIIRGPHEVPGMGAFTILMDPTGAAIALWQSLPNPA